MRSTFHCRASQHYRAVGASHCRLVFVFFFFEVRKRGRSTKQTNTRRMKEMRAEIPLVPGLWLRHDDDVVVAMGCVRSCVRDEELRADEREKKKKRKISDAFVGFGSFAILPG